MKIPASIRPDPYRKPATHAPLGPPTFRTEVHAWEAPHDPKAPPRVKTAVRETLIDRPGYRVEATDRSYITGPDGALRRADGGRRRKAKPPTPARRRAEAARDERLQQELDRGERRRARRRLKMGAEGFLLRVGGAVQHAGDLLCTLKQAKGTE